MQPAKQWNQHGLQGKAKPHRKTGAIVALIVFMTVILVLLALWASHELGALLGTMVAAALWGLLAIVALTLGGAYQLLVPVLCLSLLFPLNKSLGSTSLVIYTFDVVLVCLYGVWLFRAATGTAGSIRISAVDIVALALTSWLFISALGGTNPLNSLNGALYFLRLYLVYLYVANNVDNSAAVKCVVASILLLVVIQSSVALVQYLTKTNVGSVPDLVGETIGSIREVEVFSGYLFRTRGTLTRDTALAHWFDLLLPFTFSMLLAKRIDATARASLLLLLVIGTVALILTFTRGAWVGSCAGLMAVMFLWLRDRWFSVSNLLFVVGVLVVVAGLMVPLSGLVVTRWSETATDPLAVRKQLNSAALDMIQRYPIFGIGWDNFAARAPGFGVGFTWKSEGVIHKAHNLYLALASEAGLPGLITFLVLLLALFHTGWNNLKLGDPWVETLTIGILGSFVGVLVHGVAAWGLLTYSVFPLFWILMGLLVALSRVLEKNIRGTAD